jgi:hypothetical protein
VERVALRRTEDQLRSLRFSLRRSGY